MNSFAPFGKVLIILGIVMVIVGLIIVLGPRIPFFGKLPGDIYIKKENFRFYFPLTTCIIISIIFSLVLFIINRFR